MVDKSYVNANELGQLRVTTFPNEDELRIRAIVCIHRNLGASKDMLEIAEMLGLIDGNAEYIKADEVMGHTNNPHRRGIGNWID